jgi:hypothetical protein
MLVVHSDEVEHDEKEVEAPVKQSEGKDEALC